MTKVARSTALSNRIAAEYEARLAKNPRYSARAFARDLGVSHTLVARLLQGKASVSLEKTRDIGARLPLSGHEFESLVTEARLEIEKDPVVVQFLRRSLDRAATEDAPVRLSPADLEGIDLFELTSVLELVEFSRGRDVLDSRVLSREAFVPLARIEAILRRLKRLGLVDVDPRGRVSRTPRRWEVVGVRHSDLLKRAHLRAMELLREKIAEVGPDARYSATEFIAIPASRYAELKELTDAYLERLHALATPGSSDTVYLLALHAAPWLRKR